MTAISVLGLGRMGGAMARRFLEHGHEVTVWNRTPSRANDLVAEGAVAAESPARAVDGARLVITMLADAAAVTEVLTGPDGAAPHIGAHTVVAQMSTIGPEATAELAATLPSSVRMIDAPVKGSVPQVRDGALTILAGGAPADIDQAAEALSQLGTIRRCGRVGAGSAVKLVINAAMISAVTALAEVMAVADGLDVPEDLARAVLSESPLGAALTRADATGAAFPITLAAKDLGLAVAGREDTAVLRAVRDRLAAATHGDEDLSAIVADVRSHH